eukprot:TRINITY_DN8833_c0_g1_i1.p1 TRINITY_DN8833_c0_g1~~TRINITY_DN8833_c0_g1_i1.p1  ORF type:complete len:347 (-),score=43.87 TRINITY_DN8833_c0_g1_i1:71-1111(-)
MRRRGKFTGTRLRVSPLVLVLLLCAGTLLGMLLLSQWSGRPRQRVEFDAQFCPRPDIPASAPVFVEITEPHVLPPGVSPAQFCAPYHFTNNTALGRPVYFCHYDPANECCVSKEISKNSFEEKARTIDFGKFLEGRPPGIVVDLGTNMGQYSVVAALAGHFVYAFDPVPTTIDIARRTFAMNDLSRRIFTYSNGVADVPMNLTMMVPKKIPPKAHFGPNEKKDVNTVAIATALVTLDDLIPIIRERTPYLPVYALKIDIEGFEPKAVQGAKRFFAQYRPLLIYMEMFPQRWELRTDCDWAEMLVQLWNIGYRPSWWKSGMNMTAVALRARFAKSRRLDVSFQLVDG